MTKPIHYKKSSHEALVRDRPEYWYSLCKWTCPTYHSVPSDSKDCDNRQCAFQENCWYGHHGDVYNDAPGEANAFIHGTSIFFDKYPELILPESHHHFYRKGDSSKVASGTWRKRSNASTPPKKEHNPSRLSESSSPNNQSETAKPRKAHQSAGYASNGTFGKWQKNDEPSGSLTIQEITAKNQKRLQVTVDVLKKLTKTSTAKLDNIMKQDSSDNSLSTRTPASGLDSQHHGAHCLPTSTMSTKQRTSLPARSKEADVAAEPSTPPTGYYENATYFQPTSDPYEAFPAHIHHSFRFPEQVVINQSANTRDPQIQAKPALGHSAHNMDIPKEYLMHDCSPEYANYVKSRAPEMPPDHPNIHFCHVMQVIENLESPPPMVQLVKEYLDRLTVQARHDESNLRMKFQQLYYGLDDREVEEAFMYRRMVDEILGSIDTLMPKEKDPFRKNAMLEWFARRYIGKEHQPVNLLIDPTVDSNWYTGPYLNKMAELFGSRVFNKYLTSMHNYLLFLQVELTKTWRRIGPLFHKEWQSPQIGHLGRYGILIRALGSNGIDSEWEEFDYGYPDETGLGPQNRPPSERAEWVIELHPDFLAQDPTQLFRLVGQVLHTEDWRSGLPRISAACAYTYNDIPVFPKPPAFLLPLLPLEVGNEFRVLEQLSDSLKRSKAKKTESSGGSKTNIDSKWPEIINGNMSQAIPEIIPEKFIATETSNEEKENVQVNIIKSQEYPSDSKSSETMPQEETKLKGRDRAESLSTILRCVEAARRRNSSTATTRPKLQLDTNVSDSVFSSSPASASSTAAYPSTSPFFSTALESQPTQDRSRRPSLSVRLAVEDGPKQTATEPPTGPGQDYHTHTMDLSSSLETPDGRIPSQPDALMIIGGFHRKTLSHISEGCKEESEHRTDASANKPDSPDRIEKNILDSMRGQNGETQPQTALCSPWETLPTTANAQGHDCTQRMDGSHKPVETNGTKIKKLSYAEMAALDLRDTKSSGVQRSAESSQAVLGSGSGTVLVKEPSIVDDTRTTSGTVGSLSVRSAVANDDNTIESLDAEKVTDPAVRNPTSTSHPSAEHSHNGSVQSDDNTINKGRPRVNSNPSAVPDVQPKVSKKKKQVRKLKVPYGTRPKIIQNPTIDSIFSIHRAVLEKYFNYNDKALTRYMEMVTYDRSIFITKYLITVLRVWEETRRGEIYYNPTLGNLQSSGGDDVPLDQKGTFDQARLSDMERLELARYFKNLETYMDAFGIGVRFVEQNSNDELRMKENAGGFTQGKDRNSHFGDGGPHTHDRRNPKMDSAQKMKDRDI